MPAQPITFTYPKDNFCTINIDFEGHEYLLQWTGVWQQPPSLAHFPTVFDATVTPVPHSTSVDEIWSNSKLLKFGADAHIRLLNACTDEYYICKIAIDVRQRRLLQDEFHILRHLATHNAPVVRTHPQPLVDECGIFGFRMEELIEISNKTSKDYSLEIKRAVDSIHHCGIALHDISPSNIMLNKKDHVTMIDFGRAGYIGQSIPPYKSIGLKPTITDFSISADTIALDRTLGMRNPSGILYKLIFMLQVS